MIKLLLINLHTGETLDSGDDRAGTISSDDTAGTIQQRRYSRYYPTKNALNFLFFIFEYIYFLWVFIISLKFYETSID